MQNKYVGDKADFGKYGLLRYLTGMTSQDDLDPLRLGVVWYMVHDEHHRAGGNDTGYLRPTRENAQTYRASDPALYDALGTLVWDGNRCVHCVQQALILPASTAHYDARLYFVPKMKPADKIDLRAHWLRFALRTTKKAELVYLDPDNGIARNYNKMLHKDGPKFTYLDDLRAFWARGQSLVIYHHLGMGNDTYTLTQEVAAQLVEGLEGAAPIALRYRRGSPRVFYMVPQPEHGTIIRARVDALLTGPWNRHFVEVY